MNRAILVKTCCRFEMRQRAAMAAWAANLSLSCFLRFVSGGYSHEFWTTFEVGTTCGDDYEDNTLKLRDGIRWMLRLSDFTHIFICDDDTFIHPQRWLAHEPEGELECRVFHPKTDKHRRQNNGLPWVHGGAGWWMSRRLCELYVAEVTERKSCDDIIVAQVAHRHGIEMIDRPDLYGGDYYSGHNDRVSADNSLITCHHVEPTEMRQLWEATKCL